MKLNISLQMSFMTTISYFFPLSFPLSFSVPGFGLFRLVWFQIAYGNTNEHGVDTTWPLNDNESKRAEWVRPCQPLIKIENFQRPQRRSMKELHTWGVKSTESFFESGWQTEVSQRVYNEDHPSHSNYRTDKRLCDLSPIFKQGMTIS